MYQHWFHLSHNINSKKLPAKTGSCIFKNYLLCSQTWLPTVQEVLQADWQEAGHSPQPPVRKVLFNIALLTVLMCFLILNPSRIKNITVLILTAFIRLCKKFLFHQHFSQNV